MGMSRANNFVKIWGNLPISNPKPDLHNINAHTKLGENPLMFTQVTTRKQSMDGRMDVQLRDWHTDVQHETIIPCQYHVAGCILEYSSYLELCNVWFFFQGFLVNWEIEKQVWDYMFGKDVLKVHACTLVDELLQE